MKIVRLVGLVITASCALLAANLHAQSSLVYTGGGNSAIVTAAEFGSGFDVVIMTSSGPEFESNIPSEFLDSLMINALGSNYTELSGGVVGYGSQGAANSVVGVADLTFPTNASYNATVNLGFWVEGSGQSATPHFNATIGDVQVGSLSGSNDFADTLASFDDALLAYIDAGGSLSEASMNNIEGVMASISAWLGAAFADFDAWVSSWGEDGPGGENQMPI